MLITDHSPSTPVRLGDVDTGKEIVAFQRPRGEVGRAAFSPDGKLVLSAESGRQDVRTFHSTGGQSGGSSGTIPDGQAYLWDAASGKLVQTPKGHKFGITLRRLEPGQQTRSGALRGAVRP